MSLSPELDVLVHVNFPAEFASEGVLLIVAKEGFAYSVTSNISLLNEMLNSILDSGSLIFGISRVTVNTSPPLTVVALETMPFPPVAKATLGSIVSKRHMTVKTDVMRFFIIVTLPQLFEIIEQRTFCVDVSIHLNHIISVDDSILVDVTYDFLFSNFLGCTCCDH